MHALLTQVLALQWHCMDIMVRRVRDISLLFSLLDMGVTTPPLSPVGAGTD
jgi:hypothetical protein